METIFNKLDNFSNQLMTLYMLNYIQFVGTFLQFHLQNFPNCPIEIELEKAVVWLKEKNKTSVKPFKWYLKVS